MFHPRHPTGQLSVEDRQTSHFYHSFLLSFHVLWMPDPEVDYIIMMDTYLEAQCWGRDIEGCHQFFPSSLLCPSKELYRTHSKNHLALA